jgi:WS/DGAT/MGAT family acyltransferase
MVRSSRTRPDHSFGRPTRRTGRLSAYDVHCLRVETPARPLHLGILAIVDGPSLLDGRGELRLMEIRSEIVARLDRLPAFRRVVYDSGRLAGRPLWLDDPAFDVARHVSVADLPAPADEAALLRCVEQLMAQPLGRTRPLWRMWFLIGSADGRVGVLVVLHHAFADGLTAMRMVRALLEPPMPTVAGTRITVPMPPKTIAARADPPPRDVLVRDNLRSMIASARWLARPATWRYLAEILRFGWLAFSLGRSAPASSLNAPVGPRRRLATLRLDQATAKRVARSHDCGVNDVVLSLISGGVRALLVARGEPVERLQPRAGVAVALFSPEHGHAAGNDIGTLHVALPLALVDPAARLPLLAAQRNAARDRQTVAAEPILRAWLGRFGPFRRSLEHQRLVNVAETYVPGPPAPIDMLGARVIDLIPIAPLAGNLGLSFVAFSYAKRLAITVRVDADHFPDLGVLVAAMERDWQALAGSTPADLAGDHDRSMTGPVMARPVLGSPSRHV